MTKRTCGFATSVVLMFIIGAIQFLIGSRDDSLYEKPTRDGISIGSRDRPSYAGVEMHSGNRQPNALDYPETATRSAIEQLLKIDPDVVGVIVNGHAKLYLHSVLKEHEVVNDTVGNKDIVVTYCPFTHSYAVFSAEVSGESIKFDVSSWLYESNLVLSDRNSGSLWYQLRGECIYGAGVGSRLGFVLAYVGPLSAWISAYPNSDVVTLGLEAHVIPSSEVPSRYGIRMRETGQLIVFPVSRLSRKLDYDRFILGIESPSGSFALHPDSLRWEFGPSLVAHISSQSCADSLSYPNRLTSTNVYFNTRLISCFWFGWQAASPRASVTVADGLIQAGSK